MVKRRCQFFIKEKSTHRRQSVSAKEKSFQKTQVNNTTQKEIMSMVDNLTINEIIAECDRKTDNLSRLECEYKDTISYLNRCNFICSDVKYFVFKRYEKQISNLKQELNNLYTQLDKQEVF